MPQISYSKLVSRTVVASLVCFILLMSSSYAAASEGFSQLYVTIFKLPRSPAKPVAGAIIQIMNSRGQFTGYSGVTNAQGKCGFTRLPAASNGSNAYFIRVIKDGRVTDHYYSNGLFPNKPFALYNQTIYIL